MSEFIPKLKPETFDDFVAGLKVALDEHSKAWDTTAKCSICKRTYYPNRTNLARFGKKYGTLCSDCFHKKCHNDGLPKKFIKEQVEEYIKYSDDLNLYKPCYIWLPWLNEDEINLIKKEVDKFLEDREKAKRLKYENSLLKESKEFCDKKLGKQEESETITRGQLEIIIANLFAEFDKLKDRIDDKQDREMIFR